MAQRGGAGRGGHRLPTQCTHIHLQVLPGSLQFTLILVPDHVQTEAFVNPYGGRAMGGLAWPGPWLPTKAGEPGQG